MTDDLTDRLEMAAAEASDPASSFGYISRGWVSALLREASRRITSLEADNQRLTDENHDLWAVLQQHGVTSILGTIGADGE
ncbi:MAG: hypothetical protein GY929_02715 [Actinomycetia bacterium]|nr:hypothetical protein [Actinomycetes bacterium]